jgi:hypothetical protein
MLNDLLTIDEERARAAGDDFKREIAGDGGAQPTLPAGHQRGVP